MADPSWFSQGLARRQPVWARDSCRKLHIPPQSGRLNPLAEEHQRFGLSACSNLGPVEELITVEPEQSTAFSHPDRNKACMNNIELPKVMF